LNINCWASKNLWIVIECIELSLSII
jgi:hypothetical protein